MVVETKNAKAFRLEKGGPSGVATFPGGIEMLTAIELHDQICSVTNKIGDVRTDRRLPPKTRAVQPVSAQAIPYDSLSVG